MLFKEAWGLGNATASVGAVLAHLPAYGVRGAIASVDPRNVRSARLLARLGFHFQEPRPECFESGDGSATNDMRYVLPLKG